MANLRYRRRRPHERQQFVVPVNQPKGPRPGPEILPFYWTPEREIASYRAPKAFLDRLKAIDPDLRVVFSPVHERWIIWVKEPRIGQSGAAAWLCKGWKLLFLWEHPVTQEFLPLNELVFHNLYLISAEKFPSAKAYYDKIQAGVEREKAARNAQIENDRQAKQSGFRESLQISSAGRGNRFALHHDNQGPPSQGEANWRAETRRLRLPSEVLKHEQDEKEKRFYGR